MKGFRGFGTRSHHWNGPPLAWRNIIRAKARLIVAVAAISFSVVLIFMQLGLLTAVLKAAVLLYDSLNFDIALVSPKSPELLSPQPFPRQRLYQAAGIDGVAAVMPIYITFREWRNPETRKLRSILLVGFHPGDNAFRLSDVDRQRALLRQQDVVLMSSLSRPEFGPRTIGLKTELNEREVKIGGLVEVSNTIRSDGTVILSTENFLRYAEGARADDVYLGLITLAPDQNVDAIVERLRQILPDDVNVLSRQQVNRRDQRFWIASSSMGLIVGVACVTAFVVGSVVVYQILNADVSEHLPEYATLKAMGYSNRRLAKVVLQQSIILAILGFIPAAVLGFGMYRLIFIATRLPITMTVGRLGFVFLLTLIMCSASGMLALRKLFATDPAEIF